MARVSDAASARFDWPDVSEELPAAELIPSAALTRQRQPSEQAGHPSAPRARTDGSSLLGCVKTKENESHCGFGSRFGSRCKVSAAVARRLGEVLNFATNLPCVRGPAASWDAGVK